VGIVDFDNDGFLDIFANTSEGSIGSYFIKLFRNKGDGTFEEIQHPFPNGSFVNFSFADANNDGAIDVLLAGQPNSGAYFTTLFQNKQTRTNQPPAAPTGLRANNTADGL